MAALRVGTEAPDFCMMAHDGERVDLYKILDNGSRVILTFHPASFTGG